MTALEHVAASGTQYLNLGLSLRVRISRDYIRGKQVHNRVAFWTRRLHHPEVVESLCGIAITVGRLIQGANSVPDTFGKGAKRDFELGSVDGAESDSHQLECHWIDVTAESRKTELMRFAHGCS